MYLCWKGKNLKVSHLGRFLFSIFTVRLHPQSQWLSPHCAFACKAALWELRKWGLVGSVAVRVLLGRSPSSVYLTSLHTHMPTPSAIPNIPNSLPLKWDLAAYFHVGHHYPCPTHPYLSLWLDGCQVPVIASKLFPRPVYIEQPENFYLFLKSLRSFPPGRKSQLLLLAHRPSLV